MVLLQWITDGHKNHLSNLHDGVFNIRRSINSKTCFSNLGHFEEVSTRKGSRIKKKSLEERNSYSVAATAETMTSSDNNNGSLTTTKNNRKDKKSSGLMKSFRNISKHSTWPMIIPWWLVIPWMVYGDVWWCIILLLTSKEKCGDSYDFQTNPLRYYSLIFEIIDCHNWFQENNYYGFQTKVVWGREY